MRLRSYLAIGLLLLTACSDPTDSITDAADDPLAKQLDLPNVAAGSDWPSFLGPNRDSVSKETGLALPWPETGPPIVWHRKLGISYGIGSISDGRMFQYDRAENESQLVCLDAKTGKQHWTFSHPTDYVDPYGYNGGPRTSPIVDGNHVYIYGVEGLLHCVTADTGKVVWKHDLTQEFGVVQNFFGVGSTPIIEDNLLIVMVGGSPEGDRHRHTSELGAVDGNQSAVAAFDKQSGKVVYQLSDELASYASMQVATIGERRIGFAFCRGGLLAFDPKAGKELFHFPWRARILESVNASTPVIVGDEVFISETYGVGSALLKIKATDTDVTYRVVWQDDPNVRAKAMKCHWNTPIFIDGYLYGCSGRNPPDASLRCIEWSTGKVMWDEPTRTRSSMLLADGYLINLEERGTLSLIKPNPQKLEMLSEVELAGEIDGRRRRLLNDPCWAAPILSHGLLYVRGEDRLVCLDISGRGR